MKDFYNIKDLVGELKINKETIRYYEKIGLLREPKRDENGYRIYSKEDIEMIKFILITKNFGFTLKEISILIHDEILCGDMKSIKKVVDNKINDIDNKINELIETKKLLEKVKGIILDNKLERCDDTFIYIKK